MNDQITKPAEPVPTPAKEVAPRAALNTLRDRIDALFDDFSGDRWLQAFRRPLVHAAQWPWAAGDIAPAMDVTEAGDAYTVSVELPGLEAKDVKLSVANGTLTIEGEKTETKDSTSGEVRFSERRYGSFCRSMSLPDGVDADAIGAAFARGVLKVTLPKSAHAKPAAKTIPIHAG
jgi:HSP20 family protein